MAGGANDTTLEFTPTWVVAVVCTFIVAISLILERLLHYLGKYLKKKNQTPLYEALLKIKEELMLVGFISLLLNMFQDQILKICISQYLASEWLPCKKDKETVTTTHFRSFVGFGRHLLADSSNTTTYCGQKIQALYGEVPLLSLTALHDLHIFIFVLAFVHVVFSAFTIFFGELKIRQWKQWEDTIETKEDNSQEALKAKYTNVQDDEFIKSRFLGIVKFVGYLGWVNSFLKQFHGSVKKSDYTTLRLGFVMSHCRSNQKFDFHKYMISALQADFKKVVGISWYLWLVVVIFLLLNVAGWHAYFWLAFVPLLLLLAVGTKLEHIIIQLARDVAEKHVAVEGDIVIRPSDDHFWFKKPRLVLLFIHVLLFQNSFEIAIFFFILFQYKFDSCIMGEVGYVVPRLVIGVLVQVMCSYSTLSLYALVAQMGSSFSSAIFNENMQQSLVRWARQAKKKGRRRLGETHGSGSSKYQSQIAPTGVEGSVSVSASSPQAQAHGEIEVVTIPK